jgi:hypothetical protein
MWVIALRLVSTLDRCALLRVTSCFQRKEEVFFSTELSLCIAAKIVFLSQSDEHGAQCLKAVMIKEQRSKVLVKNRLQTYRLRCCWVSVEANVLLSRAQDAGCGEVSQ